MSMNAKWEVEVERDHRGKIRLPALAGNILITILTAALRTGGVHSGTFSNIDFDHFLGNCWVNTDGLLELGAGDADPVRV